MTYTSDSSTFTVSLALAAHSQAEKFRRQHLHPHKAKQVYLNTLAIYATNFYLNCLEIETDMAASNSWNLVQQTLMDTADLVVKRYGKLVCRPVLPNSSEMEVPPEAHHNRIGYVAVRLSEDLQQATLIGFVKVLDAGSIPLSALQPIETLGTMLADRTAQEPQPIPIPLSQWFQNWTEAGWQAIDNFLSPPLGSAQMEWGFRSNLDTLDEPLPVVQRHKQFQLEHNTEQIQVSMLVGLCPVVKNTVEILVQLYPAQAQQFLPASLKLIVLDQEWREVMQAEARNTEAIQLKFSGSTGEQFSIKVTWHETSIMESFVI